MTREQKLLDSDVFQILERYDKGRHIASYICFKQTLDKISNENFQQIITWIQRFKEEKKKVIYGRAGAMVFNMQISRRIHSHLIARKKAVWS